MKALISILPGDGIGPEVSAEAVNVLQAIAQRYDHKFEMTEALIGGAAIDATGNSYPDETRDQVCRSDAVFLGAVGGPRWSDPDAADRPERGLLDLRASMGVFANLRPVSPHPALRGASPLKPEILDGVDMMVVRELTGGIYFGRKSRTADHAEDVSSYSREEIQRVLRIAGGLAQERRGRVTSVDKSNVLETSRLWRSVTVELFREEFPDLELEHLLVDAAAMHLLSRPADFDVIVTENMFGDILTDEASMLSGSMGMLPSASLGNDGPGLYEPIHGSAPDIAGQGIANPCASILSVAMLLRHSLGLIDEARAVEDAVDAVLRQGLRTGDIAEQGSQVLNTATMGQAVIQSLTGGSA